MAGFANASGRAPAKALFQCHPEFSGAVHARVIAPAHTLIIADRGQRTSRRNTAIGTGYAPSSTDRLLYRFSAEQKVIVDVSLNGENTPRKTGSQTDPYILFQPR